MCMGSAMQHSRLQYLLVGFLTGLSQPPQAHLRIAEDTTYTPCNAPRYPAALPVHHSPAYDALQQMTRSAPNNLSTLLWTTCAGWGQTTVG
jgi:hypothetical protein